MYVHLLRPFFFLYLPPSLLNDFPYSSLFPGLGGVLLPLLRQPLDPGVSDRGLLAGGRRHAEGVHQQSRPLRCLQELTGVSSCFLFFLIQLYEFPVTTSFSMCLYLDGFANYSCGYPLPPARRNLPFPRLQSHAGTRLGGP